jgi:ketosteroid isomerase-like protein
MLQVDRNAVGKHRIAEGNTELQYNAQQERTGEFTVAGVIMSRRNLLQAGGCALAGGIGLLRAVSASAAKRAGPTVTPSSMTKEEIIRQYYSGWESKDWSAIDSVLADDFTFTSPNNDDHISKSTFKTRCWGQTEYIKHFDLESVVGRGDEAFVKYRCHTKNGKSFQNIEYFKFKGGKVEAIECYFGADMGFPSAASLGHR